MNNKDKNQKSQSRRAFVQKTAIASGILLAAPLSMEGMARVNGNQKLKLAAKRFKQYGIDPNSTQRHRKARINAKILTFDHISPNSMIRPRIESSRCTMSRQTVDDGHRRES